MYLSDIELKIALQKLLVKGLTYLVGGGVGDDLGARVGIQQRQLFFSGRDLGRLCDALLSREKGRAGGLERECDRAGGGRN